MQRREGGEEEEKAGNQERRVCWLTSTIGHQLEFAYKTRRSLTVSRSSQVPGSACAVRIAIGVFDQQQGEELSDYDNLKPGVDWRTCVMSSLLAFVHRWSTTGHHFSALYVCWQGHRIGRGAQQLLLTRLMSTRLVSTRLVEVDKEHSGQAGAQWRKQ